jgi:predicted secreted hydrolase
VGAASGEKSIFSSGPDFGFQLTFFRRALFERPLVNRSSEGVLAHAALSYLKGGTFLFDKRYQRQGIGSESGLSSEHLDVSLGDWSVVGVEGASDKFLLKYALAGRRIELTATVTTPVMFQGENGFSRKGNCATCASHYYSLPRLALSGTIIESDGSSKMVTGLGWMDHEFMSNALQPEQTGWDWVSLMTKDGESIMYFQLRADSPSARFVACKRMMPDYSTKDCKARLKVESTWRSARSGAKYPAKFTLVVDEREFSLATLIEDQELSDDQMSYYEGAIGTEDRSALGYFELTGYDKPLSRRF